MFSWLSSMVVLNKTIHYQAIAVGVRSLFELLLDLVILQNSQDEVIQMFHDHSEVERYRFAKKLIKYSDENPGIIKNDLKQHYDFVNNEERKNRIAQVTESQWGNFKTRWTSYKMHWTGMKANERAIWLGEKHEAMYMEVYSFLSWHIHSGSTGYAGISEEAFDSILGFSHFIAQKIFIEATEILAHEVKIDKVYSGFEEMIEDAKLSTGKRIISEQVRILEERSRATS
jgi:hypothetical protein